MNMFVSNLSYQTTEDDLINLFSQFGNVSSTKIIIDRETGRSRGFGFVEMDAVEEAREAITQLNEKDVNGRAMNVAQARERESNGGFNKRRNLW